MEQTRSDSGILSEVSWKLSGTETYLISQMLVKKHWNTYLSLKLDGTWNIILAIWSKDTYPLTLFLWKKQLPWDIWNQLRSRNPQSTVYHETVAIGLASCLLQLGHKKGPDKQHVWNRLQKKSHRKLPCHKRTPLSMSRGYPSLRLIVFQSEDKEFWPWERIQTAKDDWSISIDIPL